jgi:two-component system, chemotaxis family, response regulator Rcp1
MADTNTDRISVPRLLLVEDNPDDAELTKRALTRARIGNDLTIVGDGEAALDLLYKQAMNESEDFGLVILDLGLPTLDGHGVLKKIWGDRRLRRIPVIVLTGSATDEDLLKSYKSGAVAFLRKPVDVERLLHAISDLPDYRLLIARVKDGG